MLHSRGTSAPPSAVILYSWGGVCKGAILHSDRGSQFTSQVFLTALRRHKLIQSMSGTGRCYDNARMESFFATLKKEKLYQYEAFLAVSN